MEELKGYYIVAFSSIRQAIYKKTFIKSIASDNKIAPSVFSKGAKRCQTFDYLANFRSCSLTPFFRLRDQSIVSLFFNNSPLGVC